MKSNNNNTTDNIEKEIMWGGLFNEFFWICSGANRKILRQCPTEYSKYFGIGGTIFFTAAMATLSGGYAFYTIFKSQVLAICFGIFWGLLIFNLDRFIVNTMYSDGKYTISWGELAAGTPRLIIAIFLGIVISTPLEMKIFEDEIEITISEIAKERIKEYKAEDQAIRDSLYVIRNNVRHEQIADDRSSLYDEKITSLRSQLAEKQRQRGVYQGYVNNNLREQNRYDRESDQYTMYHAHVLENQRHVRQIDREISSINSQIQAQVDNKIGVIDKNTMEKDNEISRLDAEIAEIDKRLQDREYADKIKKEFSGFQAHMLAFQKIKEKNKSTRTVSLFIMLMFIIIEVAPTFFKMMIASGPYDEILKEEMEKKKAQSILNVSQINDEANTQIQISVAKNKDKLEAEVAANKAVLSKIAAVQAELLDTAIEEWRKEEIAKIQADPSKYIKSNTRNG